MNGTLAIVTLLLIAVTCGVSYAGFMKPAVVRKYIFNPESILADKEFYRLVALAFFHAGGGDLFFNIVTLFFFGSPLEFGDGRAGISGIFFWGGVGGGVC